MLLDNSKYAFSSNHIFMTWTYLNYYEPLFLPISLIVLTVYPILMSGGLR